mgnify:CR=1 FL=1
MNNKTNFDKVEETYNATIDTRNRVHNVRTYVESLQRPATPEYFVRPDGSIEFIR